MPKSTALRTALAIGASAAWWIPATCLAQATGESQPIDHSARAYDLTTNAGLFSQYIFRGVSYSQGKPVVQGGADFAHSSGFYLGLYGTSLSSKAIQNAVGEIDVYGGYQRAFGDYTLDAGLLQFIFPGGVYTGTGQGYNTLEANVAVGWKVLKLKYSHTLSNYFGFNDESFGAAGNGSSRGSGYLELNAAVPLVDAWTLDLHVGRQRVRNYSEYSFTDYRVGVIHDFGGGWKGSASVWSTNADRALYTIDGYDTGKTKLLLSIARTFP